LRIDIRTAALLMVKRYGDDALQQAVNRASDLLDAGDVKGAYIWHLVRNCIERLQGNEAGGGGEGALKDGRRAPTRN
jgi:hypothetical protein